MSEQEAASLKDLTQAQFYDDLFLKNAFGEAVQRRISEVRIMAVEACTPSSGKISKENLSQIWETYCKRFNPDGLKTIEKITVSDASAEKHILDIQRAMHGVYI